MAISKKAIRIFNTIEVLRGGQADIRHALACLFEPDVAFFDGQIYNPAKIALRVNEQYKLGITTDVLEEFIPIFMDLGWLEKTEISGKSAFVINHSISEDFTASMQDFAAEAKAVGDDFLQFIEEISPISKVDKTGEELVDNLVDWLMKLDIYDNDTAKRNAKVSSIGGKLIYQFDDPTDNNGSEESFISARFVEHLFNTDSIHLNFLYELVGVGLITDVVRDFQKPTSKIKSTNLVVYLDAPVALDCIGLSGKEAQLGIKTILDQIRKAGGQVRIFRLSVEEMQNALSALLSRSVSDRTNATADALRKGDVLESFVRQVAANADPVLKSHDIAVDDRTLEQFPNEHKFFDNAAIEDFYSQISWVQDDTPRHHDAAIAALTMRRRAGTRTPDIFETKFIVVTRNPFFPKLAKRICKERSYLANAYVGPVIHQRQLATAVWLRAGDGSSDEIPKHYIRAACSRVLTLRKNIVEKVKHLSADLTPEQAVQMELLLSEGRSTQVLMDKTLGSASLIDSSNIGTLLVAMKQAAIKEAVVEADERVSKIKTEAKARQRQLSGELSQMKISEKNLENKIDNLVAENSRIKDAIILKANKKADEFKIICLTIFCITVVTIEGLTFYMSNSKGWVFWAILFAIIIVTTVITLKNFIYNAFLKTYIIEKDVKRIRAYAEENGLQSEQFLSELYYEEGKFSRN